MLTNIKTMIKTNGIYYFLSRLVHKIMSLFGIKWEKSFLLHQKINIKRVQSFLELNHLQTYNISVLSVEDFLKDAEIKKDRRKIEIINYRFKHPETFLPLGIKTKCQLVYYCWISFNHWELDYGLSGYKKDFVLLLDDYCNPCFRNQGIHTYMINYRLGYLYNNGFKDVYVFVHKKNKLALKSQCKSGFEIYKECTCIQMFNKKRIICK